MAVDIVARGLGGNALKKATLANQRLDNLPKGVNYIGSVNYYNDLLNLAAEVGDAYTVKYKGTSGTEPSGKEYLYGNDSGQLTWIELGANYDAEIDDLNTRTSAVEQNKQDKITADSDISMKTITIGGHTLDADKLKKLLDLLDVMYVADESSPIVGTGTADNMVLTE